MKNIFLVTALFFSSLTTTFAQQKDTKPAKIGVQYGATVDKKNALTAPKFEQQLLVQDKFTGKVEGKVVQVCKMSGCYLALQNKETAFPIIVRFKDAGFIVPQDLVGKTVVIDGKATAKNKEKSRAITMIADGVLVVK